MFEASKAATTTIDLSEDRQSARVRMGEFRHPAQPTHILGVFGDVGRSILYPVHAIVFALHCTHLSPFKPSLANFRHQVLPVKWRKIPHPEYFFSLYKYLYLQSTDFLHEPPFHPPDITTCDEATLRLYVRNVVGFWANVCNFGVQDNALWETMYEVYEELMQAIVDLSDQQAEGSRE